MRDSVLESCNDHYKVDLLCSSQGVRIERSHQNLPTLPKSGSLTSLNFKLDHLFSASDSQTSGILPLYLGAFDKSGIYPPMVVSSKAFFLDTLNPRIYDIWSSSRSCRIGTGMVGKQP